MLSTIAVTGGIGLLLLFLLWPNNRAAARLLRRWGVPHPSSVDIAEALTYLRRRRFWYPPLYVGLPPAADALEVLPDEGPGLIVAILLVGGLLAEAFALRRPRRTQREALLAMRRVRDFVPWWAIAAIGTAAIIATVRLGVGRVWGDLALTAVAIGVTAMIVTFAVCRPASGTVEVDLALRLRSARVAIGLGIVVCAAAARFRDDAWGFLYGMAAIGTAMLLTSPVSRPPVPAAR